MSRPSSFPDFSTAGSNTAPSPGLQTSGWVAGMKLPAQILNYLLNLNGLWHRSHVTDLDALDAAKGNKAGGNTWTGIQSFSPSSFVQHALSFLKNNTSDAIQKNMSFQTGPGNDDMRIYTGLYTSQGTFFITYNATWSGTQWVQVDLTRPSAALFMDGGGWHVGYQAAPSLAWTNWDATSGIFSAGTLAAISLLCTNITVDGASLVYSPGITVTEPLPISSLCSVNASPDSIFPGSVAPQSSPTSAWLTFPIPHNVEVGNVRFYHHRQGTAYDTTFKLWERQLAFTTGGGTPTMTAVSGASYTVTTGTAAGSREGGFNMTGLTYSPTKEYLLEWVNGNSGDRLYGVTIIGSVQNGPRAGVR